MYVRRGVAATLLAGAGLVGCSAGIDGQELAPAPAGPPVMAALGDSITRAFAACGQGGDCVEASWATGSADGLQSHWQRLGGGGAGGGDGDGSYNVAVSGARVADLASQVDAAVRVRPRYVTVLIGANDACAPSEQGMTPVEDFAADFDAALDDLVRRAPDARVLVLSIPDLGRLWEVGKDRPDVRQVWQAYGICQSMLAGPTDTSPAAKERRDRVRGRVQAYNEVMAAACERRSGRCKHDGNAVFDYRFTLDDVSTVDYWHPSARGQATLARVAWGAGFFD